MPSTLRTSLGSDGVMVITLSRPKQRNAFTEEMANDVCEAVEAASRNANVKAVVLTGDPDGQAFCAGADLGGNGAQFTNKPAPKPGVRPPSLATYRDSGGRVGLAILNCTKPVIAAVNGAAVGVGLTMPMTCDMRVVAADAKVGFPFVRRGLAAETLSSWTLSRLVGMGKAQELVLTGRVFSAKDAPPGMFNYIVDAKDVLPKAMELAREIASNGAPVSVALSKHLLLRGANMTIEEAFLMESKAIYQCAGSPDNVEGIMSFLEKRAPKFTSDGWVSLPEWFPFWTPLQDKAKL